MCHARCLSAHERHAPHGAQIAAGLCESCSHHASAWSSRARLRLSSPSSTPTTPRASQRSTRYDLNRPQARPRWLLGRVCRTIAKTRSSPRMASRVLQTPPMALEGSSTTSYALPHQDNPTLPRRTRVKSTHAGALAQSVALAYRNGILGAHHVLAQGVSWSPRRILSLPSHASGLGLPPTPRISKGRRSANRGPTACARGRGAASLYLVLLVSVMLTPTSHDSCDCIIITCPYIISTDRVAMCGGHGTKA